MILHNLSTDKNNGESISSIYDKYLKWRNLKAVLIMAAPGEIEKQLDEFQKDLCFAIILISQEQQYVADSKRYYEAATNPPIKGISKATLY